MTRFLLAILACALVFPAHAVADTPQAQAQHGKGIVFDVRPAVMAARQAAAEGDFEKAAQLYATLLKVLPNMTDIRLEYAAAARRAGEQSRAREILVPVDVDALAPGQRSAYRNITWGERAFDISFSPRVMFDSNINSGPSSDTVKIGGMVFQLAEENLPADSSGAGGTLAAQAMWMPTNRFGLGVTGIADGDFYENSDFNDTQLSVTAGPRFIVKSALFRLSALGGVRHLGNERLESHTGGQAAVSFNVAPGVPLTLSASHRDYSGEGRTGVSRDRMQNIYAASLSYDELLPWKGGDAWVNFAHETEDWERNVEDNVAWRGGIGFSLPENEYLRPHVMFNATRRLYENQIPLLGVKRAEWRLEPSVRVDLSFAESSLGVPYVQYTYTDNISNVSLTDYDQHRLTAGMTLKAW